MKYSAGLLFAILLVTFSACAPRTTVSSLSISDPDLAGPIDVPVQSNGTFSKETRTDDFVSVASGTISDTKEGISSVKLVYERKFNSASGSTKTERIETTFTAQSDVEVPIGKNPSAPESASNPTPGITATLRKGK